MYGWVGARKSFTICSILTTLVNQHHLNETCYLKVAATGKTACLIEEYIVHSHEFATSIPKSNNKSRQLLSNRLRDERARLWNLKIIFIDKYSMLRQKKLFYIPERLVQIKVNNLIF